MSGPRYEIVFRERREAILCTGLLLADLYSKDYRRYACDLVHLVGH